MKGFLSYDDVIHDVSSGYEPNLLLGNDFGKDKLEPIGYDLLHKFVQNNTKAYRAELREVLRILNFGDENNQGIVEINIKDLLDPIMDRWTNNIPLFLEEESMKTITALSFQSGHVEEGSLNVFVRDEST